MRRLRTAAVLLATVGLVAPLGSCKQLSVALKSPVIGSFIRLFANAPKKAPGKAKAKKLKDKRSVDLNVSIGGLSGTYALDFGALGMVAGTAEIKGSKKAKIRSEDDADVMEFVENWILLAYSRDIAVTETKVKINGRQTTGGVKKKFNGWIKFEGTIETGEGAGNRVSGKIKSRGSFK